jgi:DDE superfamily endonuclease
MEPQPETDFPATLSRWVQEIVLSLPGPARSTLAELIFGAMLAQGGPVTRAVLALTPRLGWQAYHWMLERGRFRLLGLVAALCGIIRRESCEPRRFAIIDDTLAPRCSAKAPGAAVRFDHARKTNRPTFLLCQAFVTLCTVVPCRDRPRAVPILTGLCRGVGHAGKIALAKTLLRAVGDRLGPLCLLLDAWSMRGSVIRAAGHTVVGQVRRDTALFDLPPPRAPGRRGRSRLYGAKLDAAAVAQLPVSQHRIGGYAGRMARLRHLVCRPRFLRGVIVHAVWGELRSAAVVGPSNACCCRLTPPCRPSRSSKPTRTAGPSSRCSPPSSSPMAWARCGSEAGRSCCAGFTWSRSVAPCWSCSPPRRNQRPSHWSDLVAGVSQRR